MFNILDRQVQRRITNQTSEPARSIVRCTQKDGAYRWVELQVVPVRDEQGRVDSVIGCAQDVTSRLEAQQEIERLRREFVAAMARESRIPLAAIKGAAWVVKGRYTASGSSETPEFLSIISEQADRLKEIVDAQLEIMSPKAQLAPISLERHDLRELLERALADFTQERGCPVRLVLADTASQVLADAEQITRAIAHLLSYALDMGDGASLVLETHFEYGSAVIAILSNPDQRACGQVNTRLFPTEFDGEQGERHEAETLAIARQIIAAHGGNLEVTRNMLEDRAVSIRFTLPVPSKGMEIITRPDLTRRAHYLGRVHSERERSRILVADEDPQTTRLLQRVLNDAGYNVLTTNELDLPEQLQQRLEEYQPDLVLLSAPRTAVLDAVQSQGLLRPVEAAPVIVLTPQGKDDEVARALRLGAADAVTKPLATEALLARIEAVLQRRYLHDTLEEDRAFTLAGLSINFSERRVTKDGISVPLTATEYKILYELATNAGKVLTYDYLLQHVWGPEYAGEPGLVRSFIRDLRRKLGDDAKRPYYILNERSVGYRMPHT